MVENGVPLHKTGFAATILHFADPDCLHCKMMEQDLKTNNLDITRLNGINSNWGGEPFLSLSSKLYRRHPLGFSCSHHKGLCPTILSDEVSGGA